MIIDCAHYQDGRRREEGTVPLQEAAARCDQGGFIWLGLFEPGEQELAQVRDTFGLHELAVEDAQTFHLRPKIETYDHDVRLVILRTARYDDDAEEVEFGEISVFLAPTFVITVRQGVASELREARWRLEQRPELLAAGSTSALWAILDQVVDAYAPVISGLERDIDQIEATVFLRRRRPDRTDLLAAPRGHRLSTVPSTRCSPWSLPSSARPKPCSCSRICATSKITCCWSTRRSPPSVTCSARYWRPTWQ